MNRKRNRSPDSDEEIRATIRKLELQLTRKKDRRRIIYTSSSDQDEQEHVNEYTRSTARKLTEVTAAASPTSAGSAPGTSSQDARPGTSGEAATARLKPAPATSGSATAPAADKYPEVLPTSGVTDPALDEDVLMLLGDAPEPETDFGNPVHKDIATRWQEILAKGLSKDMADKLLKEYLIPRNCDLLASPVLNPELKGALSEFMIKRDAALSAKQRQIGIALAALSRAVELVINKETSTQKILKPLGDACRMLCDTHFSDTKTRRGFVIAAINADLKDAVAENKRDKFLFGSNMADQLKSAKTVKQSGSDLKQVRNEKSHKFNKNNFIKHKNNYNRRLNWKTSPRRAPNKQEHPQHSTRRPTTRASFQQRGKSERSPARRSRRH